MYVSINKHFIFFQNFLTFLFGLAREKAKIFSHFKGIRGHRVARELRVERLIEIVNICRAKIRKQSLSTFYPHSVLPCLVIFAAQTAIF
jgi:hypothetical protein